jgi:hypothetical protein
VVSRKYFTLDDISDFTMELDVGLMFSRTSCAYLNKNQQKLTIVIPKSSVEDILRFNEEE